MHEGTLTYREMSPGNLRPYL